MSDYISEIVMGVINRHIDKDDCSEDTFNLRVNLFNEFDALLRLKHLKVDLDKDSLYDALNANTRGLVSSSGITGDFTLEVNGSVNANGEIEIENITIGSDI